MINPNKEWEEKAEKLSNFSNLQLKKLCDLNLALEQCISELHSAYPYYNSVHSITSYYYEIRLDIECECEYSMQVGCMSSRTYIPDSIENLFQGETLGYPFAYFLSVLPVQRLQNLLWVTYIYSNIRITCTGGRKDTVANYHRRGTRNKKNL